MSQNCNKIVNVADDILDAKVSSAQSASRALSAALSDCHRAVEMAHGAVGKPAEVYLRSADQKLSTAIEALSCVEAINRREPLIEGVLSWTQNLDFERLYAEGVSQGMIPDNATQWSRLRDLNIAGELLAISEVIADDLACIQTKIRGCVATIETAGARRNPVGVPLAMLSLQSAMLDAAAFAQMVAYVNSIEPLDLDWLAPGAVAAAETIRS